MPWLNNVNWIVILIYVRFIRRFVRGPHAQPYFATKYTNNTHWNDQTPRASTNWTHTNESACARVLAHLLSYFLCRVYYAVHLFVIFCGGRCWRIHVCWLHRPLKFFIPPTTNRTTAQLSMFAFVAHAAQYCRTQYEQRTTANDTVCLFLHLFFPSFSDFVSRTCLFISLQQILFYLHPDSSSHQNSHRVLHVSCTGHSLEGSLESAIACVHNQCSAGEVIVIHTYNVGRVSDFQYQFDFRFFKTIQFAV